MPNTKKFKEALSIVQMAQIRHFEALPDAPEPRSERYIAAREELLRLDIEEPKRRFTLRRAIAAVLIAALILAATACAVIKPIREFFVEVFDEYIRVEPIIPEAPEKPEESKDSVDTKNPEQADKNNDTQIPQKIETTYKITNIPDGFTLIEDTRTSDVIATYWADESGSLIVYEQTTLIGNDISLDASNAEYSEITIGDKAVFRHYSDGMYILMWVDHGYLFTLCCSDTVPWETIVNMIADLAPEENAST